MKIAVSRLQHVRKILIGAVGVLLFTGLAVAGDGDELKQLGYTVQQVSVPGDASLDVLTPLAYQWDDETYTTLYVMDGRTNEQIAAAVASFVNQRVDVLPVLIVRLPVDREAGLAVYMEQKLVPVVEKNFRVAPFRMLAGNLVTSTAALQMAADHPGIFHAIISEGRVTEGLPAEQIDHIASALAAQKGSPRTIAVATEQGAPDLPAFQQIATTLKGAPDTGVRLIVQNAAIPADQKEAGILLYKGLISAYTDWYVQGDLVEMGLEGIEDHYESLSDQLGAEIPVPQELVYRLARENLNQSEYVKLLETLKFNVSHHPNSAKAHAALAQGWDANYRVRTAVMHYKRAVSVAKKTGNPSEEIYRALLDDANQRLVNDNISKNRLIQKSSSNKLGFSPQTYSVF